MPWLWLVPLAFATLWVWLEVAWGWLQCRQLQDLREWRAHLDRSAVTPRCALCGNRTHTYLEHVKIPQAELAGREETYAYPESCLKQRRRLAGSGDP